MFYMRVVKRGNPWSSHYKEKKIFFFHFILYPYQVMGVLIVVITT